MDIPTRLRRIADLNGELADEVRALQIQVGLSPSAAFMAGYHSEPQLTDEEAFAMAAEMELDELIDAGFWNCTEDRSVDVWPVDRPAAVSDADLAWAEVEELDKVL